MLYKGLKGKARIPTDYLIHKTRRGRNQHTLAFQIPSTSKDVYKYSFFPQTIRDWGMTSLNLWFLLLNCQMIVCLRSPLSRPMYRAPLQHTLFYCHGALFPGPDKTCNQFPIQFFTITWPNHSKLFSCYINHISGHALTLKQTMNRPFIPDSYPILLPNSVLFNFCTQPELTLRMCGIREAHWMFIRGGTYLLIAAHNFSDFEKKYVWQSGSFAGVRFYSYFFQFHCHKQNTAHAI